MNRILILLLLTSFTTLTVACGNNENNENNPVTDSTPDTVDGDETPDTVDGDETDDEKEDETDETGDKTYVSEVEPNDDAESATPLTVGQGGSGTIGEPKTNDEGDEEPDLDVYAIELQAGDVLSFKVDETSAQLSEGVTAYLEYPEGNNPFFTTARNSREFYIPVTGTYLLGIGNGTLLNQDEDDDLDGGAAYTYKFSTSRRALSPKAHTFSSADTSELIDSRVESYTVTSSTALLAQFSVFADDPDALDPMVYVVDASTKAVVAFNDDLTPEENFDAQIAVNLEANKEYIVVVDKFAEGADQKYSLVSKELDDRFEQPTTLVKDMPLQGTIGAVDVLAGQPDIDFFEISLAANEIIRIEMAADAGATINPGITLQRRTVDEDGAVEFTSVALAKSVGGLAAMTYQHVSGEEIQARTWSSSPTSRTSSQTRPPTTSAAQALTTRSPPQPARSHLRA